ncbi:MAG: hypothetical protein II871_01315 [Clostridia bacterium]|nr:hypothetical protein [Clostridia bacterium]
MNKHFKFALMQFIFSFLCFKFQQYADSGDSIINIANPWFFYIAVCAAVIGLIAAFIGLFKSEK